MKMTYHKPNISTNALFKYVDMISASNVSFQFYSSISIFSAVVPVRHQAASQSFDNVAPLSCERHWEPICPLLDPQEASSPPHHVPPQSRRSCIHIFRHAAGWVIGIIAPQFVQLYKGIQVQFATVKLKLFRRCNSPNLSHFVSAQSKWHNLIVYAFIYCILKSCSKFYLCDLLGLNGHKYGRFERQVYMSYHEVLELSLLLLKTVMFTCYWNNRDFTSVFILMFT